jgi:hypothetical protein
MSSAQEIYNRLFAGEKLKLQFESFAHYETLRTMLCKKNSFCVALEMTSASVVARFDRELLQGTFELSEPVRLKNQNKWQILDSENFDNIKDSG